MVTLFYIVIMTSFFSQIAYVILHYFCNEIFTNPSISTIAAKAIPLEKTPSGITPKASSSSSSSFQTQEVRDPSPAKLRHIDKKFRVSDIFSIITPKSSKVVMQFEDDLPYEVPLEQEFYDMITMICKHREKLGGAGRELFDDTWGFHQIYFHDELSLKSLIETAEENTTINSSISSRLISSRNTNDPTRIKNGYHDMNDMLSCFDTNGQNINMLTRLYWKLIKARQQSYQEIEYCDHNLTPFNRAYRIMHLLQKELMEGYTRRILESYENRLNLKPSTSYSYLFKSFSLLILVCAYISMLGYVIWFGSQETDKIQITLCQSYIFWLFLEICVYLSSMRHPLIALLW